MTTTQTTLTLAELAQFTGDIERYRHPLNHKVIYTPGVKYLADRAGAYWLIDAIASYFGSPVMKEAVQRDYRIGDLHFWNLDVLNDSGTLTAVADVGEPPFITQSIPYTDIPLDHVEVWAGFDGRHWTLYLPSEH